MEGLGSEADIAAAVAKAGYRVGAVASDSDSTADEASPWKRRFLFAAVFTLPIVLEMFRRWIPGVRDWPDGYVSIALLVLATPVYFVAGYPFHRAALRGLRHGTADMNTLISVGTL